MCVGEKFFHHRHHRVLRRWGKKKATSDIPLCALVVSSVLCCRVTCASSSSSSSSSFAMEATDGTPPPSPPPPPSGGNDIAAFDLHHRAPDGTLRNAWWPNALGLHDTTSPDCIRIPGHYHALLALAGETPETAQQIEKDLPRTGATFAVQGLLKPGAYASALPWLTSTRCRGAGGNRHGFN